jgi:hypothetical protein
MSRLSSVGAATRACKFFKIIFNLIYDNYNNTPKKLQNYIKNQCVMNSITYMMLFFFLSLIHETLVLRNDSKIFGTGKKKKLIFFTIPPSNFSSRKTTTLTEEDPSCGVPSPSSLDEPAIPAKC